MTNKTPHIVGGGLGTIAQARLKQQQAEQARLDRKAQLLATARTPQADKAKEYKLCGKSFDLMDSTRPARIVFEAALQQFLSAQSVKDGTHCKGAIAVAVDAAAEELKDLFEDPRTQKDAIVGADWATEALKWAGRRVFNQKSAQSTKVKELVSA